MLFLLLSYLLGFLHEIRCPDALLSRDEAGQLHSLVDGVLLFFLVFCGHLEWTLLDISAEAFGLRVIKGNAFPLELKALAKLAQIVKR